MQHSDMQSDSMLDGSDLTMSRDAATSLQDGASPASEVPRYASAVEREADSARLYTLRIPGQAERVRRLTLEQRERLSVVLAERGLDHVIEPERS